MTDVISVSWDGVTYYYNSKSNKYWKEVFKMGFGWTKEKSSSEEFTQAAKDFKKVFGY